MGFSLLDRLTDYFPQTLQDISLSLPEQKDQIIKTLVRDLENLLNTKSLFLSWPAAFKEIKKSVLGYGVEDFSTFLEQEKDQFCFSIEKAISLYEPRLKNVTVSSKDEESFLFIIEAEIYIQKLSNHIFFNVDFIPPGFHCQIKSFNVERKLSL